MAFPAGLLFVCLHCVLSYHGATAPQDLAMAYLRIVLAAIAFVVLILSILPRGPSPSLTQDDGGGGGGERMAHLPDTTAQCGLPLPLLRCQA